MLVDEKLFNIVEKWLRDDGHIDRFENECGPVKGRMMITRTDIPDGIEIKGSPDERPVAFEASFDFYDAMIGIAVLLKERQVASDVWVTPQEDGAETPSMDWVEFFIKTLFSNIGEDGSYGVPIYSLVNDVADLTIVPADPNPKDELNDDIQSIEYFCTNCGAVLNKQEGFDPKLEIWKCKECGTIFHGDSLDGIRFKGVAWYCDCCGAYLNAQEGFTDLKNTWRCRECGYENKISADEIIDNPLEFGNPKVH